MIRIYPNDLVTIEKDGKYYYALILSNKLLLGGQYTFVFHQTTSEIVEPDEILKQKKGFFAIIDFIWAKRENRILRVERKVDLSSIEIPQYLKNTHQYEGKALKWWIYNLKGEEVKIVSKLNRKEKKYPFFSRIDDQLMIEKVNNKWTEVDDKRI